VKRLLLVLILLLFSPAWAHEGRYQIIDTSDSPTLLLDTEKGIVWRNVYCPTTDGSRGVLGCWQLMEYDYAPINLESFFKSQSSSTPIKK